MSCDIGQPGKKFVTSNNQIRLAVLTSEKLISTLIFLNNFNKLLQSTKCPCIPKITRHSLPNALTYNVHRLIKKLFLLIGPTLSIECTIQVCPVITTMLYKIKTESKTAILWSLSSVITMALRSKD
jgi:hypothetical protein